MPKHHDECQFDLHSWQEIMDLLMSHLDAQITVLEIPWIFLVIPSFVFVPRVYVQGEKFRWNNVSRLKSTSRCKGNYILCFHLATLYFLEAIARNATRYQTFLCDSYSFSHRSVSWPVWSLLCLPILRDMSSTVHLVALSCNFGNFYFTHLPTLT